jgi:hypothetical protein
VALILLGNIVILTKRLPVWHATESPGRVEGDKAS